MSGRSTPPRMEKITQADMVRFHGLAETTLRRCGPAFFHDEFGRAVSWIIVGAIPIVGLVSFGWSATQWMLFLLIGAWVGIICDAFKFYFLQKQIMASANAASEDNFVWTIVDSLRAKKEVAPSDHLRAKYQPGIGIVIDIVFGGVGTIMVLGLFPGFEFKGWAENGSLKWSVAGFVAYRVAFTIWEILEQRSFKTEDRQVRVAVGLRGVGLFMLGFLVAFISGDEQNAWTKNPQIARWVMLAVNSLAILGSLLCIWGVAMIRSNAHWLQIYMDERGIDRSTKRKL